MGLILRKSAAKIKLLTSVGRKFLFTNKPFEGSKKIPSQRPEDRLTRAGLWALGELSVKVSALKEGKTLQCAI